jgi:2-polyprenyl-3-methyl-5-hydroxy-6-metoxy-1,4-benzoquinol methylase
MSITGTEFSHDDELFAQGFELRALANAVINKKSERWVDGFVPALASQVHVKRYSLVAPEVKGLEVADIACGAGKGTKMLFDAGAVSVTGIDIDDDTLRYCRIRNGNSGITYLKRDLDVAQDIGTFDCVTSFQTIEHLRKPDVFLQTVYRSLKSEAHFFISTPIGNGKGGPIENPFHYYEWTVSEFKLLLEQNGFQIEKMWYQGVRGKFRKNPLQKVISKVLSRFVEPKVLLVNAVDLYDSETPFVLSELHPKYQVYLARARK